MNSFGKRIGTVYKKDMCIVEDSLRHILKQVKSCANFSIKLHALHVIVFPFSQIPFSQMSVRQPDSEFPGDRRPELGNQPVVQNLLRGFNIRKV